MIPTGKCPKCDGRPPHVKCEAIDVKTGLSGTGWAGVSYLCPLCNVILGVSIDPVALKTDTIEEIQKLLRAKMQ